jgi:hypothetical protein
MFFRKYKHIIFKGIFNNQKSMESPYQTGIQTIWARDFSVSDWITGTSRGLGEVAWGAGSFWVTSA